MKFPLTKWHATLIFVLIQSFTRICSVSSQCLDDQKSLLLDLQDTLVYNQSRSAKLVTWNKSTDCCQWSGVECDQSNGRVIGLNLSHERISGGIDNLSSLFRLQYLQMLDLTFNQLVGNIPSAIGNLSGLTYLSLSDTTFRGQIPIEISKLVNLATLDLSTSIGASSLYITSPSLPALIQNLTNVRDLYLDGIPVSAAGNKWGEAFTSLPNLEILSMRDCNLTGGFHPSLAKLHYLSILKLDENNFAAPVPDFIANFNKLTELRLSFCELLGTFPQKTFQITTLEVLDISLNYQLTGSLPNSIGNLKRLASLDLPLCNFQGIIPPSLGSLSQLEHLDLSLNKFSGPLPSFLRAKKLRELYLADNSLSGSIPESIFPRDSALRRLSLNDNNLEGPIPQVIFQLGGLESLLLDSNRLNGSLNLHEILLPLQNLSRLYLSNNNLAVDANGTTANFSYPMLKELGLGSCRLQNIPAFPKNQLQLQQLDLSSNQISGEVPEWIWNDNLQLLNLSCNCFVGLAHPLPVFPSNLRTLDLHSNNLRGRLPALPPQTAVNFLDFSNNSFTTFINPEFAASLSSAQYISLARNKIYGSIPESLCNATALEILDLSDNALNSTIPVCLIGMAVTLGVLNLRGNTLHGGIPDEFGENCKLETLIFNENVLDGNVPRSLANCKELKILDLGNNRLNGTFPCHLKGLSNLQVLVLRSNIFHGSVICPRGNSFWPLLQIIDLASNHLSGQISTLVFGKSMMAKTNDTRFETDSMMYLDASTAQRYYHDEVRVTLKGSMVLLEKILTIFTSIDLSNNAFHGALPGQLGKLNSLLILNISHNSLSGNIPSSIGNLIQLESLDLSCNALTERIPQQLGNLNFLGYLNLSFNNLEGQIPIATQLQSFDASSYEGNPRLYGPPLTLSTYSKHTPDLRPNDEIYWRELEWMLSGAAIGFPTGIIIFFGPLVLIKRWREYYNYHVDRLIMKALTD